MQGDVSRRRPAEVPGDDQVGEVREALHHVERKPLIQADDGFDAAPVIVGHFLAPTDTMPMGSISSTIESPFVLRRVAINLRRTNRRWPLTPTRRRPGCPADGTATGADASRRPAAGRVRSKCLRPSHRVRWTRWHMPLPRCRPTTANRHQVDQALAVADDHAGRRPLFLFVNVSATHVPHGHYLVERRHDRIPGGSLSYTEAHPGRLLDGPGRSRTAPAGRSAARRRRRR